MRKILIVIGIIIIVTGIFWFFGPNLIKKETSKTEAAEIDIVLEVISGSVVLKNNQGQDTTITKGIAEVVEGDIVKTQADSLAVLYFSDDTLMRLDQNTEIKMETYSREGKTLRVAVGLTLGRVWSRLERVIEADSLYEVRTSNTVAAVRGTSFGVNRDQEKTEVIVSEKTVEVQAIDPLTKEPLAGGFIKVGEKERAKIIDTALPSLEKPLQAEKLSAEDLEEKWLKFNLEEDGEQLKELKIEDKRNALEEKKGAVGAETKEIIFIEEKSDWQRPALLERIEALKGIKTGEIQPKEETIKKTIQEPAIQERAKLTISGLKPKQSIGNGYIDYISLTITGAGFTGVKGVFLGSAAAESFRIIDDNNLSARISGKINHGLYDLNITRDDGAKATLSKAIEVLKPVGW